MNGGKSLVRTLVGGGVEVCSANPGTSEMRLVAALDRVDGMRCVLGVFEGVVTAAADERQAGRDAPPSRPWPRQRSCQHPQCQQGDERHGQHRRRPCDLSPPLDMLDLGHPDIGWVGLAKSLGVPGARVADMDGLNRRFAEGLATPGPYLVEVVV